MVISNQTLPARPWEVRFCDILGRFGRSGGFRPLDQPARYSAFHRAGRRRRNSSRFCIRPFWKHLRHHWERRISRFPRHDGKSPHSVTFVKELPKTATGKIREIHFASAPACDRSPVSTLISKRVSGICFLLTRQIRRSISIGPGAAAFPS
jgi:hypothetical protein